MMTSRIATFALVACSSFAAVGCSSENPAQIDDSTVDTDVQHIDFDLSSLDGASVEALNYTLTNATISASSAPLR